VRRPDFYEATKRVTDVVVAAVGLLLLSPLLAGTAVLVAITMGRPVLFVQHRPGRGGRLFRLLKFRSMREGRGTNRERLTSVGRFLRRCSLDELPEFWNVLVGEMSLVGPRPLLPEYLELYTAEQARRHDVMPGLTGWAQVNGRNAISWERKLALDVWYVDHRSAWLDVRILLLTSWKVLTREGVQPRGLATMARFTGASARSVEAAPEGTELAGLLGARAEVSACCGAVMPPLASGNRPSVVDSHGRKGKNYAS
jgi:lipopolysaccharide/colanic/teichoic acid biosynthesis glycosyltransferase